MARKAMALLALLAAAACLGSVAAQEESPSPSPSPSPSLGPEPAPYTPLLRLADLPTDASTDAAFVGQVIHRFAGTSDLTVPLLMPDLYYYDGALDGVLDCAGDPGARRQYHTCADHVSLFSGLTMYKTNADDASDGVVLLGTTDRGPNQGCKDIKDGVGLLSPDGNCTAADTSGCNGFGRLYYGVDTFRGQTMVQESASNQGQGFSVPRFSPSIMAMQADKETGALSVTSQCSLWYPGVDESENEVRVPLSGLPNWQAGPYVPGQGDNVPYGPQCTDPQATDFPVDAPFYNPAAVDVEDIQVIPGTSEPRLCLISDEYSPSLLVINCDVDSSSCGQVMTRYVPQSLAAEFFMAGFGGYAVSGILPDAFLKRRTNKGLENLAVSPDGLTAWTMMQSAMGDDSSSSPYKHSFVLTAAKLDLTDPNDASLVGVYLYVADDPASWVQNPSAKSIYASSFAWASQFVRTAPETEPLAADYPLLLVGERAKDQVKTYLVDFSQATDVSTLYPFPEGAESPDYLYFDSEAFTNVNSTTFDVVAALNDQGIKAALKIQAFDTGVVAGPAAAPLIPGWTGNTAKQEGVLALSDCVVAIGSDNDFGFNFNEQSELNIVHLPTCITELYASILFINPPPPPAMGLRIIHVNDMHARIDPADSNYNLVTPERFNTSYGGLARLASMVAKARAESDQAEDDILVLHAGDQYTGTMWHNFYTQKGDYSIAGLLNTIGFDAFTAGNHEFDDGAFNLAGFATELDAGLISCNVDASASAELAPRINRYTMKMMPKSGKLVAIIGLTPPDTAVTSSPGPNVRILSIEESLPGCIADVKAGGADVIILLSHIGYYNDLKIAADPAYSDIDIIVGGHSHTFLNGAPAPAGQPQVPADVNPELTAGVLEGAVAAGPYPTNVLNGEKTIPVVQALWGSRYAGNLFTQWDNSGNLVEYEGAAVLLGGNASSNLVGADPDMAARIAELREPMLAAINQVIGQLATPLEGSADRTIGRNQETNTGNLVCQAMMYAAKNMLPTAGNVLAANPGVPLVCIQNAGGLRTDIPAGDVTKSQVQTLLPFGNTMVLLRVNASILISALNNGLSGYTGDSGAAGRFPQIGGMRLAFDPSAADKFDRLVGAVLSDVAGTPSLKTYEGDIILLTNSFVANGGDNYTALGALRPLLDTSVGDAQIVADYITANSPVTAVKDGRIANCVADATSPLCARPAPPPVLPARFRAVSLRGRLVGASTVGTRKVGRNTIRYPAAQAVDAKANTFAMTAPQVTPWMSIDLGRRMEVQRVVVTPAPTRLGAPAYTPAHTFTLRISDVKPVANARLPNVGIDRRAGATCTSVKGPLRAAGSNLVCGAVVKRKFRAVTKKGRYVTVEVKAAKPTQKVQLALMNVVVFARATR